MYVGSVIGLGMEVSNGSGWIRNIFMPLQANSVHPIFWDLEKNLCTN